MKRVFIVHGWGGHPEEGWFPWLRRELESRGFRVYIPQLPEADTPRIKNWVPALAAVVGGTDESTFFVGHSMGCQTIARYLESLPEGEKVGGAVFVAGFFSRLANMEDSEAETISNEWLGTPLDLQKVKAHLGKSVAIFSDDDPWVPIENKREFQDQLGSEIVVEHAKGHFSGARDKAFEAPVVLEKLLELTAYISL